MKRSSTLPITGEMQIKIIMRCHLTKIKMAPIKKQKPIRFVVTGESVEKLEPLYTVGGNTRWYSQFGKE